MLSASENHISVREELSYTVDHTLMGAYNMYKDVPLTAVVTKMLCILPEEPMTPRLADSRLGLTTQLKSDYSGATQESEEYTLCKTLAYRGLPTLLPIAVASWFSQSNNWCSISTV